MSTSTAAAAAASGAPQCTICLDPVSTRSQRSMARLFCGHSFHLDCIGSEFNFKRSMQCPNCRLVEQGNWRFAAGGFQQAITNDGYLEPENDNEFIEEVNVDDFLRVAMQPTTISIVSYNMVNEFQYARSMFRTLQPQPQPEPEPQSMPPSVQLAPVPRNQIQRAAWGSAPRTAATTSATPQVAQRRSRNRASPALNQDPAPRGQVARPSTQAHQPRLPRNRGPAAPTGTGPAATPQRRPPSNRAAAVTGSPSRVSHRDIGTSMPQPSTPSSSSQGSAGQLPRHHSSMGYFMRMLTGDSDDEDDDLPIYQFL